MDKEKVKEKITELFKELNIPVTEGTEETPDRMARMLTTELLVGLSRDKLALLADNMTTFNSDYSEEELSVFDKDKIIEVKGIPFYSLCEHHMLPFYGFVDILYKPKDKILGLSKFARVVKFFSAKPQVQENLAQEIANFLAGCLNNSEIAVTVRDCHHMCMEMRGVQSIAETTVVAYPNRLKLNKLTKEFDCLVNWANRLKEENSNV